MYTSFSYDYDGVGGSILDEVSLREAIDNGYEKLLEQASNYAGFAIEDEDEEMVGYVIEIIDNIEDALDICIIARDLSDNADFLNVCKSLYDFMETEKMYAMSKDIHSIHMAFN